jgi:hypothetical protein
MRYGSGRGRRTEQCDEETCAVPTSEEDDERRGGRRGKKGSEVDRGQAEAVKSPIGEKPRRILMTPRAANAAIESASVESCTLLKLDEPI